MQKFRPKILPESFFNQQTLRVAQKLLGKFLVRRFPRRSASSPRRSARREIAAMITEVEAYIGPEDKASHASRGRTERTKIMFGKPGQWYVYMIYGMYYCLNIVTEKKEYPAAVLIRSVAVPTQHSHILKNVRVLLVDGPGRVCKYFKIDKRFNGKPADKETGLWIESRGVRIAPHKVKRGKRIGVEYAGKWKHKPWRFWIDA